ncbi:CoB--CoM heterodisulfide reductase iron-sulfur subunit B family protein [Desulfopila inferna]|uniref:CoB--CoM heterodisulfide reductase iron-sulfur subunit B family protein n=1 Tax=Desulfopila inferna TaxID=468528 RepID=UPI0019662E8D|nr:CoB--CoM heterodisulfide reductase iron-sulfur subunit B family protein [Desulfopila inferna]MBM9605191.1 CoB--CoM heterodisulfide reductase iron-sulfur subunit B family protein [Desulfopila inferna]
MEFCLFLGCNTPAVRPDVERAIRASMEELDVDLVDADNYVCCPAFGAFPSTDEDSWLATSGWNLSIAEQKKRDILVQCGSCYSSLRMGREHIMHDEEKKKRVNELLEPTGRSVTGSTRIRHVSEVLYREITPEKISEKITLSLKGLHGIVQYPCHTLYPSEVVGFEDSPRKPKGMRQLVEALGATVDSYSREMQCCGGAGGFMKSTPEQAIEFAKSKFDAILEETKADFIAVSCITCLMHMENVQNTINKQIGEEKYKIPVFDYNQLLALCLGKDPKQVSSICNVPRDAIHNHLTKVAA